MVKQLSTHSYHLFWKIYIPKAWVQKIEKNPTVYKVAKMVNLLIKMTKKGLYNIWDRRQDRQHLMVNVGGQNFVKRHWKNMDFVTSKYRYFSFFTDYPFDLTSSDDWPFASESVSVFYSSHTIEHIPQEYTDRIFQEMFRCLKPGGVLRLTMPDFDLAYAAYGRQDPDFNFYLYSNPQHIAMEDRFLHFFAEDLEGTGLAGEVQTQFQALSKDDFANYFTEKICRTTHRQTQSHISWWTYEKTQRQLKAAGFSSVYRSEKGQSCLDVLRGHGIDERPASFSLFVEAVK